MLLPPDVLGHLAHRPRTHRPKELRMVVSKVPLCRYVELALIVSCELRPALAVGDPLAPSIDRGRVAVVRAAMRHL